MRMFLFGLFAMTAAAAAPVQVSVDLARSEGPFVQTTNWFGYDEANYTTMANGRALLKDLHDAYAVSVHIRAHHLFTSGDGTPGMKWSSTGVFKLGPDGKPVYDFKIVDAIFDAYKQAGVTPTVELGFMPQDLSVRPEPYHIAFGKGEVLDSGAQFPPKDYALWGELVRTFVAHLRDRYGAETTRTWLWEVWNEPDIPYWHGTREEYFKLYDYAVAGVRAALPGAKVGGPATTNPDSKRAGDFLRAFLEHCAQEPSAAGGQNVPLDFISFHAKGAPQVVDGRVRMGLANELKAMQEGFRIVAASPYAKLPIVLSEADPEGCAACSAKQNPANAYRNGPLYAAYTAAAHKAMLELAAREKVNLAGMLSWSFEFENTGYFEGFRSLASNGIGKPVLNFFRMAGKLEGDRVAATSSAEPSAETIIAEGVRNEPEIGVLATRKGHRAAVMLWNYHDDDKAAPASMVSVNISGLPKGSLRFSEYRIDDIYSNAYAAWKAMGSPQSPTSDQLASLRAIGGVVQMTNRQKVKATRGTLTLPLSLPRPSVSLFLLDW
jgi:xylan 1,4-beta-xylosidase